jgi:hypothetical protein
MTKPSASEIKRGQAISFRIPSDTPDHILKGLQKLKETERRNFSSKIAEFVLEGVNKSYSRERETVTIPLPHKLTKAQRDWLKHEHSEALLGSILHQLIADPVRSASLLASFNSNALDIDEALYLQEEIFAGDKAVASTSPIITEQVEEEIEDLASMDDFDDDLDAISWENINQSDEEKVDEDDSEDDVEDLLGGFLASMNK